jgi:hypothetical protein
MLFAGSPLIGRVFMRRARKPSVTILTNAAATAAVLAILAASGWPASAASLTRSVDVDGTPQEVWSAIGPFCAIRDWHPAIGSCTEDGKTPPTRTLVTKDGTATFVELQIAASPKRHRYSYTFVSSPLPVRNYRSTLMVTAGSNRHSVVTWSGEYTPEPGKDEDAVEALSGIYDSGLQAIKTRFEK